MNTRWDKWGANLILRSGILRLIEDREAHRGDIVRILDYHRVGIPAADRLRADPSLYSATPEAFVEQMQYLARHYHPLSLEELLESVTTGRKLPPRSVMVTFDDGYRDFMVHAWPVLRGLKIPAVLFVVTDYLSDADQIFWWDKLYQAIYQSQCGELSIPGVGCWSFRGLDARHKAFDEVKQHLRHLDHHCAMKTVEQIVALLQVKLDTDRIMLNWDEVRAMQAQGLYVCAHTQSHPILSRMSPQEARHEIIGSHETLRRELSTVWPAFAYPVGHPVDMCPQLIEILREEGFQVAMTMVEGHNIMGLTDPLRMKRVGMASHVSLGEFRVVLTRLYNLYGALANRTFRD